MKISHRTLSVWQHSLGGFSCFDSELFCRNAIVPISLEFCQGKKGTTENTEKTRRLEDWKTKRPFKVSWRGVALFLFFLRRELIYYNLHYDFRFFLAGLAFLTAGEEALASGASDSDRWGNTTATTSGKSIRFRLRVSMVGIPLDVQPRRL
jgi:hypothetical protein